MDFSLVGEYFLLVLISAFSTIQIVSHLKNKEGLKILKNQDFVYLLYWSVIIGSFTWFFSSGNRNIQTYMEGGQISVIFGLGSVCAILLTLLIKKFYGSN